MSPKPSQPLADDLPRLALIDAIKWRDSLADAFHGNATPEGRAAAARATAYRAVLEQYFGSSKLPSESALDAADAVPVKVRGDNSSPSGGV